MSALQGLTQASGRLSWYNSPFTKKRFSSVTIEVLNMQKWSGTTEAAESQSRADKLL